jgi:hypothetical protein
MALKPAKRAVPGVAHEARGRYAVRVGPLESEIKGTKRRDTLGRGLENAPRGRAGLSTRAP